LIKVLEHTTQLNQAGKSISVETGEELPVMEQFYTIQGEGYFQGQAAYFIRLGGCDVGCHWCDVKESWPIDAHPITTVQHIAKEAAKHPARLAVITGGEPLIHNLFPLTQALKLKGFHINIETSGSSEYSGEIDWICLSPKKFKMPLQNVYKRANELKVIIFNKYDFAWAVEQASLVSNECLLYLQPEWDRRDKMTPLIIEFVKENPRWRISLQTHKYLEIP